MNAHLHSWCTTPKEIKNRWFLDSCASRHLCNDREHLIDYRNLKDAEYVNASCEGGNVRVVGVGNLRVRQVINGEEVTTMLKGRWLRAKVSNKFGVDDEGSTCRCRYHYGAVVDKDEKAHTKVAQYSLATVRQQGFAS